MSYSTYGYQLTQRQKNSLRKALGSDGGVTLNLKKHQLQGPDNLMVPSRTAIKSQKHFQAGKGMKLTLSKTALNKNKRGGSLMGMLAAELAPIYAEVASDALGSIFGSGLGASSPEQIMDEAEKKSTPAQRQKAVEVLSKPENLAKFNNVKSKSDIKKAIDQVAKKEKVGSGMSGGGWKEALTWAAVWLNPIGMFTGPIYTNIKAGQKIAQKVQGKGVRSGDGVRSGSGLEIMEGDGCGCDQEGGGLMYFD